MDEGRDETADFFRQVKTIFTHRIAFNEMLGMQIDTLTFDRVRIKVEMRDVFVGNFVHGSLHGGVISAVLDVTGALIAFMEVVQKMGDASTEQKLQRLSKFGTIDLRIDYLRPGVGEFFLSQGRVLRAGNKVSVARMELHNHEDLLIAVGTGTYVVG